MKVADFPQGMQDVIHVCALTSRKASMMSFMCVHHGEYVKPSAAELPLTRC